MQTINVRTTQNVLIDYPIAELFDRIFAFLIDLIIFIAYLILAFYVTSRLGIVSDWVSVLIYLPAFFYTLIFEIAMNGQTPGKRAKDLKVVRLDGNSPTIANYIMRFILWPIDVILSGSIAITFILLTKNGQRLGDLAAGTTVVKLTKRGVLTGQEIVQNLTEDYQPLFPQVIHMTDKDIGVIKEALHLNVTLGNDKPVYALAAKIMSLHGIQTDMPPVKFLYTVLKDYHHLTSAM